MTFFLFTALNFAIFFAYVMAPFTVGYVVAKLTRHENPGDAAMVWLAIGLLPQILAIPFFFA